MIKHRDTYKFCTNCKTQLVTQEGFKACPHCQKQYYFNAKPTVSIVLTNNKNEVLLTKRAFAPYKDWWDLPGGFVEENETLEQAAQREIKEEVDIIATDLNYVGSFSENYHFRDEIIPVVAAVFTGKVADDTMITVGDDVSDYKFIAKKDIDPESIAFDNQREFLQKIIG